MKRQQIYEEIKQRSDSGIPHDYNLYIFTILVVGGGVRVQVNK